MSQVVLNLHGARARYGHGPDQRSSRAVGSPAQVEEADDEPVSFLACVHQPTILTHA
jgi:hypothetical protein